jgi:hypothetical protein
MLAVRFVFTPRIGRSLALSVTTSTGAPCAVNAVANNRRDEEITPRRETKTSMT